MKFLETLLTLLVPEDQKIARLLKIDSGEMRLLLPKSSANIKNITVLFDYGNNTVRALVKSIKYKNNLNLKKRLASYLYEDILEISSDITLFEGSPPILIPMPMSKNEKSKKGFNQCEELCKEIERLSSKNITVSYNTLKKIKETKRQTELSREARLLNTANSMVADSQLIKNKTVIVLDDVYTTLATFSEASRALTSAGAHSVHGIFLAH